MESLLINGFMHVIAKPSQQGFFEKQEHKLYSVHSAMTECRYVNHVDHS